MEAVENGSQIANQTAESLHTVVTNIGEIITSIDDIANSSRDQSEAITRVNTSVEQLSVVTQNNSASSEESAAAAEELAGQANTLKLHFERINNNIKIYVNSARISLCLKGGGCPAVRRRRNSLN